MQDEKDLFTHAMTGVRRVEAEPRHPEKKKRSALRRELAAGYHAGVPPKSFPGPEKAPEPWVLKADGISQERLRLLAGGRPSVDMDIDLHGMTREQAFAKLSDCIQQALREKYRVLSLVHGRGLHSKDGRPVLKEAVYHWLAEGPCAGHVLAVIPRPGSGGGSCLVLLRRQR